MQFIPIMIPPLQYHEPSDRSKINEKNRLKKENERLEKALNKIKHGESVSFVRLGEHILFRPKKGSFKERMIEDHIIHNKSTINLIDYETSGLTAEQFVKFRDRDKKNLKKVI